MAWRSQVVSVEGVETHYLEAGEGETLVLIHGGGSGADAEGNWQGCIPAYAKNFRVVAVDMPGFGRSGRPDTNTKLLQRLSLEGRQRQLQAGRGKCPTRQL